MPRSINDGAYSPFKIIHHRLAIEKMRRSEPFFPVHVQLVPTNRCNQSCRGCAYRLEGNPSNQNFDEREEIPWDKLAEIISDCERMGARAIEVTGGGEPSLHPDFLRLCLTIIDAGLDLAVVTNGTRIDETARKVLMRAKWVRFSIDAGDSRTYAEYRGSSPGVYDRVRDNLRDLVQMRNDLEGSLVIGVGFVVNRKNWSEVVEAAYKAREDGADNIRISALFHPEGEAYFSGFYDKASELCKQAESLGDSRFSVFNLFGDRVQDLRVASPDYDYCGYSRLVTYIGADQKVYACCNNAYNDLGEIGSIAERSLAEVWFSEPTERFFRELDPSRCPRCMFNSKNRTVLYAIDPDPLHVNFL